MPQMLSAVARWPVYGPLVSGLDTVAQTMAGWIEITQPAQRERLVHWMGLCAILAVAVFIRFLGLGGVGLHGDEETMALAVQHALIDGTPRLPSGMFYPRGLLQQILMVGSVQLFGMSEWALRLPSAVFGALLIPCAFLLGRRFLVPNWNVAFVAAVAFLPEFVVYSQTARMYIFLLVAIAVSIVCVFQWERDNRFIWLAIGVISLIAGIELHALAAFSSLIFLMPGIVRGDFRRILYGCAASFCVLFGYLLIDAWVNSQYPVPPSDYASDLPPPSWRDGPATTGFGIAQYIVVMVGGVLAAVAAIRLAFAVKERNWAIAIGVIAVTTVTLQLLRYYHLAAFAFLAAGLLTVRFQNGRVTRPLAWFAAFCGALAVLQAALLYLGGIHSLTRLVGSLIGQPSVWPYLRVAGYSHVAAVLCAAMIIVSIARFARRKSVPDYFVFGVLTVGIPLFVMGLFLWDLPIRYTVSSALPLLLCALAFLQSFLHRIEAHDVRRGGVAVGAFVACVLITKAFTFAAVINPGYDLHPDHKGAAEFIRSQTIRPEDVVLAEDVLQQTYYLGKVDYWLISREHARRFVHRVNGRIVDFYTNTPVVSSAEELDALLQRKRSGRIFIIGSGENREDGRLDTRGASLQRALYSDRFEVVFTGRDGFTRVWREVDSKREAAVPAPVSHKPVVAATIAPMRSKTGAAPFPD